MSETHAFRSVVFDCDSTLSSLEGIDELAGPHADEIRRLTGAAMDGRIPLEEVYGRRLALIRPQRARVEALGEAYVRTLVPDAVPLVEALIWLGIDVRIVSAGLRPAVVRLATELGLAPDAVAAVDIEFTGDGEFSGFDAQSPLTRSGGKPEVVSAWSLPRPSLLVGDGVTDLEAAPAVDRFVAYMGVVHRPAVAAGAATVLRHPSLAPVLSLVAGEADRRRLTGSQFAEILARGDRLLADAERGERGR
jgi:phosphoserine phosphatase